MIDIFYLFRVCLEDDKDEQHKIPYKKVKYCKENYKPFSLSKGINHFNIQSNSSKLIIESSDKKFLNKKTKKAITWSIGDKIK